MRGRLVTLRNRGTAGGTARATAAALAASLALLWAGPVLAAAVRVEAAGAVAIDPDNPPSRPPRDAALRAALADAVWQVALREFPGFQPERDAERLATVLGDDPLQFATRYQILEDRGEGPAEIIEGAQREYVVVVQAHVDADRVRQHLVEYGLLAQPSGEWGGRRVRIVLEDVDSYGAYRAVQTLLEELGVRFAVPVEMERGRAVLDVDTDQSPEQLLRALMRAAPPNLSLVPLDTRGEGLRLRARFQASQPGSGAAAPRRRD